MQDTTDATALLRSVIAFLNDAAIPKLSGREAFDARVAVRALGIVQRELELRPHADARELDRLRALLHQDGALEPLNRLLCDAIAQGRVDLSTPGLADHLWSTTLAKIAIDQPTYPSYLALVSK